MTESPHEETWRVIDLYPVDGRTLFLRGECSDGREHGQSHVYLNDGDGATALYLDGARVDRSALLGKVTGTLAVVTVDPRKYGATEARFRSK